MNEWEAIWRKAQRSEFGLIVRVNPDDIRKFQKVMYEARRGIMELMGIQMCNVGDEVWLTKETAKDFLDGAARRTSEEDQP